MGRKKVAVIGGGPAGFIAAITAAQQHQVEVFEQGVPLKTILYTGNGRCNLTNNIYDFKELASNYPRGEKFLYSVFSRFGVRETLDWFNSRGLATYVQDDNRIFPTTNRAVSVRELLLKNAGKMQIKISKNAVFDLKKLKFDSVIISTGGKNHDLAKKLGHNITPTAPSLTSVISKETWIKGLAGVSVKNARVQAYKARKISDLKGDFVFTHKGLSGPVIFNTTAYCVYEKMPVLLKISFIEEFDVKELETEISVSNSLKSYIPKSLAVNLLKANSIDPDKKSKTLSSKEKQLVHKILTQTEFTITATSREGEIVTAGGVDLKEINPKSMESKLVPGVYFCGEVMDIDGLSGGFNLQACWSTGYIAGQIAGK